MSGSFYKVFESKALPDIWCASLFGLAGADRGSFDHTDLSALSWPSYGPHQRLRSGRRPPSETLPCEL